MQKTNSAELDSFSQGVLYAASLLVAIHDQPTMAASILREADLNEADCSALDDFEKRNLRRIQGEKAIALRGL